MLAGRFSNRPRPLCECVLIGINNIADLSLDLRRFGDKEGMGMRRFLGALAVAGLVLAGCSGGGDDAAVTVTSTVSSPSESESTPSSTTSSSKSSTTAEDNAAANTKSAGQGNCVSGYTEAPGQVDPHCLDKAIASCGDPNMHQQGTTFFTDGTSGWTAQCAAQMGSPGGQGAQNPVPTYESDDDAGQYAPPAAEAPVYEEPSYEEPSAGTGDAGTPALPDGAGGGQAGY